MRWEGGEGSYGVEVKQESCGRIVYEDDCVVVVVVIVCYVIKLDVVFQDFGVHDVSCLIV
jgi:hypothetical protein